MRRNGRHMFCIVLFALLGVITALALGGTASMSRRVTDPIGLVLVGARVEAVNVDTSATVIAETNQDGLYSFPALLPGTYRVTVDKQGFQRVVRPKVELHVAQNTAVDFTLEVGAVTGSLTVEGSVPLVNTTTSSLGGLIEAHELANLPLNGRNYIDLTLMQPGITTSPNVSKDGSYTGTWFSSNGAPIRSNNFTMDGAIMQDLNSGSTADFAGRTLGLDGIQEYRVVNNAFSAEYGMSMGSQSVMVSKSGSNKFHGSIFEYFRNSALDAANYFDKPVAANGFKRLPPFKRNNFGGSVGGPIVKNKTFFHLTFEGVRESLGTTNIANVPAAECHGPAGTVVWNGSGTRPANSVGPCTQLGTNPNGANTNSVTIAPVIAPLLALYPLPNLPNNQVTLPYTQPDSDWFGQVRVDHTFSTKDTAFFRYTISDDDTTSPTAFPNYFLIYKLTRHQYATLSETHIFSPSLLNTARLSFSRTAAHRTSPSDLTGPQYSFVPGRSIGNISIGGITGFGPATGTPSVQTQNIITFSDDLNYIHGKHSLKFGTLVNNYRQYVLNNAGISGSISFSNLANFLLGRTNTYAAGTPGSIMDRTYQFFTLGFYAQDDWRVRPNLVVNAGLRYEFSPDYLNEVHGISAGLPNPLTDSELTIGPLFKNPTYKYISPRLGFAWDVFGNHKTAVRGGAAILYDIANLGTGVISFNLAQPPFSSRSQMSTPANLVLPLVFPASAVGKAINVADWNFKSAQLYTANLTVEQQLPFATALVVSYAGSRGLHLPTTREANPNIATRQPDGSLFWSATATRINPNWGSIQAFSPTSDSVYHSLQITAIRRMTGGLQFQSSYTWSKVLDSTQGGVGDNTASSTWAANPYDQRYSRGPASFSLKHTWSLNAVYLLPSAKVENRFLSGLTSGWALSGIFKRHSGFPFTPMLTVQRSRSGVRGATDTDSPNWNPAFTGPVILGRPDRYYDPDAFILQPVGTLGNVGRNSLTGPGYVNLDVALRKNTKLAKLGEAGNVEFRAEFFNILNHPNFSEPDHRVFAGALNNTTESPLASAGVITSTRTPSRQIEFVLRISF
jgi:Carboxypeptidase regulatory-like domain